MNSLDQAFVDLALDGDQDKLRHLLLAGAGVNSKNTHGKNAMVLLAERVTESLCRMKLLVDMGATIDSEVVNHAREQRALLREFVIPSGNVDVSLHTDSEEEFYERMHTALRYEENAMGVISFHVNMCSRLIPTETYTYTYICAIHAVLTLGLHIVVLPSMKILY